MRTLVFGFLLLIAGLHSGTGHSAAYTYHYIGEPLRCVTPETCGREKLSALSAYLTIDEDLLGYSLENASVRTIPQWDERIGALAFPDWLIDFEFNYFPPEIISEFGLFFTTDSKRRIISWDVWLYSDLTPWDWSFYTRGAWMEEGEDCGGCNQYSAGSGEWVLGSSIAPVPVPPALLPFMSSLFGAAGVLGAKRMRRSRRRNAAAQPG